MTRERRTTRPFQQRESAEEANRNLPAVRPELVEHLKAVFSDVPSLDDVVGAEDALGQIAQMTGQDQVIEYLEKLSQHQEI